jgi:hypothetical protein
MRTKGRSDDRTCFLNVDLDVAAARDLLPLVHALCPNVFDLHTGPAGAGYQTHLELASRGPGEPQDADAAIKRFLRLLAALPLPARRLWNSATQRDFNIGIQAGTEPRAFEFALQPETLKMVARLGARVVVTVYAADTTDRQQERRSRKRRR